MKVIYGATSFPEQDSMKIVFPFHTRRHIIVEAALTLPPDSVLLTCVYISPYISCLHCS
jgi:hypothetical protein